MRKNKPKEVWNKVKLGPVSACWLWGGGKFPQGYGRFCFEGKSRTVHKFVYELVKGKVPNGLNVMHKCNNKLCCNPKHLKCGTPLENTRHASSSGAFKTGASKIRGVGFIKNRGYWHSQGWIKGKRFNLYTGPSKEKAIAARKKWEKEYEVSFNLNQPTDGE
jgi:HNH endonuclease